MKNQVQTKITDHKITTAEDQELDYWSNEFGISKDELKEAAKAGETSTEAVEKYVKRIPLTV
jgi:hypothetical protein